MKLLTGLKIIEIVKTAISTYKQLWQGIVITVLFISLFGSADAQTIMAEADSICDILKHCNRRDNFQKAIKLVEDGAYCTCSKTTKNSAVSTKKFGQGMILEAMIKGIFGAGSSTSTFYWNVLSRKYSTGRDSLLMTLTEHDNYFNKYGGDRYITAYVRKSQENFNAELLSAMFEKADKENKEEAFDKALENNYDQLIDIYFEKLDWEKNGVYSMEKLVLSDTLALVEQLFQSKKMSIKYTAGRHRYTILQRVLNDDNYRELRKLNDTTKLEFLELLKRQKFDFNWRNKDDESSFETTIKTRQHVMFEWITMNQTTVLVAKNKNKQTALHKAVLENNPIMVGRLLQLGVDPDIKDKFRKKASDYAKETQPRIMKLLGQPFDTSLLCIRILNDYANAGALSAQGKDSVSEILGLKRHQNFHLTNKWGNVEYHILKDALSNRNFFFANEILAHKGGELDSAELFLLREAYNKAFEKDNYEGLEALIGYCEPCRRSCASWILKTESRDSRYFRNGEALKLTMLKNIYRQNVLNRVIMDNGFSGFHTKENVLIGIQYDEIKSFGNQTWTLAKRAGKWGVIDFGLNEVVPFEYDSLRNIVNTGYQGHSYVFSGIKAGNHFVVSISHNPYYELSMTKNLPKGHKIGEIRNNNSQVTIKTRKNNLTGLSVIYGYGNLTSIYPPLYEDITMLKGKIFAVKKGGKWSLQPIKEYEHLVFKWAGHRISEKGRIQVRRTKRWKDFYY